MPNWCHNTLEITGPKDQLERILGPILKDDDSCISFLETYVPRPEESKDEWNEWNCKNWGTKWPDDQTRLVSKQDNGLKLRFLSAWGPPREGITMMSKFFPELEFALGYAEPLCNFQGRFKVQNGMVSTDKCEELDWEPE
jgi:hypothetical protein